MSEEQCNGVVEVNCDFWMNNDYRSILNSGVPLSVDDSRNNWMNALFCSKPEIYHHPSIVNLLKSAPVLKKDTACCALNTACKSGDIERVKELLSEGLADINNDYDGETPLMHATNKNQTSVMSLLLTYKDLVLDKATKEGYTALHFACDERGDSFPVIPLLGSDKRCTPVVLNKKDSDGDSPLMWAVMFGNLQSLREMEKLQGTNFRTENKSGKGLLDVAKKILRKKSRKEDYMSVLHYLLNRRKVESLKVQAARAVACLLSCETDVEKLEVPRILHPWVAGFLQTSPTSPIMNIDRHWLSDSSDDEEVLWWMFSDDTEDGDVDEEDDQ